MRTKKAWIHIGLLVGALGAYFLITVHLDLVYRMVYFFVFQSRDLARARELLAGHMIYFGPEMTGGGNLPGPFYYFLLAVPLAISATWQSALYWLIMLAMAAGIIGWFVLRARVSVVAASLFIGFYAMSNHTRRLIDFFLNVSYLLPFALVALLGVCEAFGGSSPQRRARGFLIGCFFTGLGLQLHFSIVILFIAMLVMQVFAEKLGLEKIPRAAFVRGVLAFLAPSVPYLVWRACDQAGLHFGQMGTYSGSSHKAIASLLLMVPYITALSWGEIWSELVVRVFEVFPCALFALLVARLGTSRDTMRASHPYLRPLLVCAVLGFVPFSYWFIAPIGVRYGIPFYFAVLLITVILFDDWLATPRAVRRYNWVAGAMLVALVGYLFFDFENPGPLAALVICVVAVSAPVALVLFLAPSLRARGIPFAVSLALTLALGQAQDNLVRADSSTVGQVPQLLPRLYQWYRLWREIYLNTGWSYDEAIHRLFFINHHLEQDPRPTYDAVVQARPVEPPRGNVPDGFFIAFQKPVGNMSHDDLINWLMQQNIQRELKTAIKTGELRLGPSLRKDMLVVPYRVVKDGLLPRHFHDYGEAYERAPAERLLDRISEPEGTRQIDGRSYLFKWNECPGAHPFCATGALVAVTQSGDAYRLVVTVVGAPISQVSPWISPDWTQAWVAPYVEMRCGDKTQRFDLATSIGYSREYAGDPAHLLLFGNNSFVAPFVREFSVSCGDEISEISVGREGSTIETLYSLKTLPAKRLTMKVN